MYVNVSPACMSVRYLYYGAHRGQKRVSDTLKLELHTVVDHHEGSRY